MQYEPANVNAKTVKAVVVRCDELYVGSRFGGYVSANTRVYVNGKVTFPLGTGALIPFELVTYDNDGTGGTRYDSLTKTYTNGPVATLYQIDVTVALQPATANSAISITLLIGGAIVATVSRPAITNVVTMHISDRFNVPAGATIAVALNNPQDVTDVAGGSDRSSLTIRGLQDAV